MPVTSEAAGEARKTTAPATSIGSPSRPRGMRARVSRRNFSSERAGADIALGLRDAKAASGKKLASEIEALGRRALPLQMDVAHLDQIESATAAAEAAFGRIDVLLNNAGIGPENLAENVNEADFDATLAVNLKGTFFAAQAAGRRMIARKSGRIINMSSQAGQVALKGEAMTTAEMVAFAYNQIDQARTELNTVSK